MVVTIITRCIKPPDKTYSILECRFGGTLFYIYGQLAKEDNAALDKTCI